MQAYKDVASLVASSNTILVMQADNPDGDSLASTLALEEILGDLGKDVYMYCSINVSDYLKYMDGWSRVSDTYPSNYDLAIMVDNSYLDLLSNLSAEELARLKAKPLAILDHHGTETDIDFAEAHINDPAMVSTGQLIYNLARDSNWDINPRAAEHLVASTLSDTLGLTSDSIALDPEPISMIADLVREGVDLSQLNAKRLEEIKTDPEIVSYRGQLLQRIKFHHDASIATIDIPHSEIKKYGGKYNPTVILDEMRMVRGVKVCIGFKKYMTADRLTRVTARIRCTKGYGIAKELAEAYEDGGGHPYASGIKWQGDSLELDDLQIQVIERARELLSHLDDSPVV